MSASNTGFRSEPAVDEVPGPRPRWRHQMALGFVGIALVAAAVLVAALSARTEWAPPLELSVVRGQAGQSVATVNWGSTRPAAAELEIVTGGRVQWSSPLPRGAGAQSLVLPGDLLGPGSQVAVAAKGRTLREVDG